MTTLTLAQAHDRTLTERILLDQLYVQRLALTNGKGLIVPLGDLKHGVLTGTTVTGIGGEQPVFTLAGATSFNKMDTPPARQGIVPYLTPNQSDEWLESPDASFWTDTAGASEPSYTFICYVKVVAGASNQTIWAKTAAIDTTGTDWALVLDSAEKAFLRTFDDGNNGFISSLLDVALSEAWHQIAFTKTTGTTSGAFTAYVDAVSVAETGSTDGTYTEGDDSTTVVRIGAESDGGLPLGSPIALPLFVPGYVMSAAYIKRDFDMMKIAMAEFR